MERQGNAGGGPGNGLRQPVWAQPDPNDRCHRVVAPRTREQDGRRVTEPELIERVLAGDRLAERELYDRHVDRVYRLAYRLAHGDPELARDFTQDAFVRAFDRLSSFRGDAALSTWLHSITVSVALNGMRKVNRWRARETELTETTARSAAVVQKEPGLRRRLRVAIGKLPMKYRVVFLMYDVEGYTHEEIGTALDMPTGTSKARLSRARAKLRAELAEFAGEWAS